MTKTTQTYKSFRASLILAAAFVACAAGATPFQAANARQRAEVREQRAPRGPLWEVTGRRRVALLVSKSLVVDAREPALAAFDDIRRALAGSPPQLHVPAARLIAARLNKYVRKYRMMTAADDYAKADLFIVFKVTGQRPSAIPAEPFVWGKMYVIAVDADRSARVVWESEADDTPAEEAADEFLKAYRTARGEK
ncbi:MAG: hypothetical protein ABW250_19635 [Pyrinomonadaceae bacterium]